MRVCIAQNVSLTDHLALSTYLTSLTKYLSTHNDLDVVLITSKGQNPLPNLGPNVDIREINSDLYSLTGNLTYARNLARNLMRVEREEHLDVIHCLYPLSSVMGASAFKKRFSNTRLVYDIRSPWIDMSVERGSIPEGLGPVYKTGAYAFEKILAENVDGFIFITSGLKDHYSRKLNLRGRPNSVIPSGIDLDHFSIIEKSEVREKYGIENDEIILGYVGGVSSMRELDFLIRGFREASNHRDDIRLMIVGDGDALTQLKRLSEKLGCRDRVVFTGRIDFRSVPEHISALDAGICHLPDRLVFRYSFPMKILEYLGCGIRVLASDIHAHREIKRDLDGITIYYGMQSFVEILKEIRKQNKRLIPRLQKYSWSTISQDTIELWERAIERGWN